MHEADAGHPGPGERDVWWAEGLGLTAAAGVFLAGFLVFTLASWMAPQLRGLWTLLTTLPSLWGARRAYGAVKRRRGFASEGFQRT